MRIVVSDSICLINLREASLLEAFLRLSYELLIPNTLFEDDHLRLTAGQKKNLLRSGLKVIDLPGKRVLRAQDLVRRIPQLSVHDGFAFAIAEDHLGCILLTGDRNLRALATQDAMEVHDVSWALDEIYRQKQLRSA